MEHVGIRFISRGTLTIINLDIVSGAGRAAMELGRSAANLVTIIKSHLCVFQPFCVTGSIEDRNGWIFIAGVKNGMGGTGRRRKFK